MCGGGHSPGLPWEWHFFKPSLLPPGVYMAEGGTPRGTAISELPGQMVILRCLKGTPVLSPLVENSKSFLDAVNLVEIDFSEMFVI